MIVRVIDQEGRWHTSVIDTSKGKNEFYKDLFNLLAQYGHALFMHLSQNSDNFNEKVAERKWAECVRTTQMTKDCLAHYYAEAKKRLGPDWKVIVRKG